MKNLIKAVNAVMSEVKGIDKNLTVGEGKHKYDAVADKDVKLAVSESMAKHGLAIFPKSIDPNVKSESWTEKTQWGDKRKTSAMVEVITTYELFHESGESIQIQGYGHGIDSQDKAAGKATTYALKNALLYLFLIPTGKIDDTDATHSEDIPPKSDPKPLKPKKAKLTNERFEKALEGLKTGNTNVEQITRFDLTPEQQKKLNETLKK